MASNNTTSWFVVVYTSEAQNQETSRLMFLLEAIGENWFPSLFHLLETTHSPWFLASSSNVQSSSLHPLLYCHILLIFSDSDPPFCHYIRTTQIIQVNLSMSRSLLITSATLLLSHNVMHAKVVYIRMWTSLRAIVQLTITRKEVQELVSTKTYPKSYG